MGKMRQPRKRTSAVTTFRLALARTARGLASTYSEWLRPKPWSVTVGKLEPGGNVPVHVKHSGPRTYCDRCNVAHTRFVITLPSGLEIHFCGHHYNKHRWALATAGFEVKELPDE